jgi:hypothetical protein
LFGIVKFEVNVVVIILTPLSLGALSVTIDAFYAIIMQFFAR